MGETGRVPMLSKDLKRKRVNRFLLLLGWVFFIGLFLLLFLRSPLSKLDTIEVSGNEILDTQMLIQLSGLSKGDPFFFVHTAKIKESILTLPEVKNINVVRKFPGKITLEIEEYERVAYLVKDNDHIIPVLENGRQLENRPWNDRFIDRPLIRYWRDPALLANLCMELAKVDSVILHAISEIQPSSNEDPLRLVLYMKDGYEVQTSIRNFAKNMEWYPSFVASLKQEGNPEGIIMLLEGKWFVPYEEPKKEEGIPNESS